MSPQARGQPSKPKRGERVARPFAMPALRSWIEQQIGVGRTVPPSSARGELIAMLSGHAPRSFGQTVKPKFIAFAINDLVRAGRLKEERCSS